jgi:predicted RNA-binding Zn-ribbon protein involved in translation (DUF1610 family)
MDYWNYDDDEYEMIEFPIGHAKALCKCPACGNSCYAYCHECGHSFAFGTTRFCTFEPEHSILRNSRMLFCTSCGAIVAEEGVITKDGELIPFKLVKKKHTNDKEAYDVSA